MLRTQPLSSMDPMEPLVATLAADGTLTTTPAPPPFFAQYKRSARARRKRWRLTPEFFDQLTRLPCHYCGRLPEHWDSGVGRRKQRLGGARSGVDRVNNRRGYEVDNVVPCCWPCNAAKSTHSERIFRTHCRRLVTAGERDADEEKHSPGDCVICYKPLRHEGPRYCRLCETFAYRDRHQIPLPEIYALAREVVKKKKEE